MSSDKAKAKALDDMPLPKTGEAFQQKLYVWWVKHQGTIRAALQPHDGVDVEALKRPLGEYKSGCCNDCDIMRANILAWNACIDHLAAKGYIKKPTLEAVTNPAQISSETLDVGQLKRQAYLSVVKSKNLPSLLNIVTDTLDFLAASGHLRTKAEQSDRENLRINAVRARKLAKKYPMTPDQKSAVRGALGCSNEREQMMAAIQDLAEGLRICRGVFGHYADLHRAKNTSDGDEKAEANAMHSRNCNDMLYRYAAIIAQARESGS